MGRKKRDKSGLYFSKFGQNDFTDLEQKMVELKKTGISKGNDLAVNKRKSRRYGEQI